MSWPKRISVYRGPRVVIIMAMHWNTCYRLSTANIRALPAARHIDVSSRTILSWVHTVGPLIAEVGRHQARPLDTRWWCDETYVLIKDRIRPMRGLQSIRTGQ